MIDDLRKRSFLGVFIYPIALSVVFFADGFYFRHTGFSLWFLFSIFGICLFRLVHLLLWAKAWKKEKPETRDRVEKLNLVLFFGTLGGTAMIWGIGFALMMAMENEVNVQLLMLVCTIGMCAGGVCSFSPNLMMSSIRKKHGQQNQQGQINCPYTHSKYPRT